MSSQKNQVPGSFGSPVVAAPGRERSHPPFRRWGPGGFRDAERGNRLVRQLLRGSGTTIGAIKCIDYAVGLRGRRVNRRVLNNRWGGGGFSQVLEDAIAVANEAGMPKKCQGSRTREVSIRASVRERLHRKQP